MVLRKFFWNLKFSGLFWGLWKQYNYLFISILFTDLMALSDSTVCFYFNKPCWLCLQNTTRPKMLLTKSSTSPRITTVYCQDYRTPPSPNLKPRLSIAARVNLLKCASDGIISLLEILRWLLISEQSQGLPTLTPLHRFPCSALPASRLLLAIMWTQP